ncbi:MAG: LysR family transcriptional regulator [Gammaproteobacteria bacterium]|nr:LysR family transcriptional regulator [Gammaproteobacteria bacterium]MBT3860994.1 LysR family transcriptional regulator [Gammaproteobacteria bacterium]MBT3986249.1 LysR family transcriptional regulator [Gammaproteobacteria bacterium]MBT4659345.1 LysR family transcriptional regulator [Gammaproteobacteria bacterium]MBT4894253.1 LysR family transcriptional regulator [Gammaproteobacteria bacterium]
MKLPRISLEQWLTFKSVVDQGSYAKAAEALNKSQSSVSYAIARLNDQLPQPVLSLRGRKAVMTEAGQILYRHAVQLLNQAAETETIASSLAMGFESEVTVAVDVLVDPSSLICAFEEFSKDFPNTRIRVLETSLSGTTDALLEKQADLVIGSVIPLGFIATAIMQVHMIPVAAPSHLLNSSTDDISEVELRAHRQVVLRDTGSRQERDAGWLQSEKRWTVSHFSTSVKLIRSGLAFGFLPIAWIEKELASGELEKISMQQIMDRTIQMYLMQSNKHAAGPATRALAELISSLVNVKPTASH